MAIAARPWAFGAAILAVPFLDVLGALADPEAPLARHEADEWGDVDVEADREVGGRAR